MSVLSESGAGFEIEMTVRNRGGELGLEVDIFSRGTIQSRLSGICPSDEDFEI